MSTQTLTPMLNGQYTGIRRELGRYTIDGTERILFGQRVDHTTIKITDKPAVIESARRSYRVEMLDSSEGYAPITALVRDYIAQAHRTCRVPAAPVTDGWFDDLADSFRYDRQRAVALQADAAADEALHIKTEAIA